MRAKAPPDFGSDEWRVICCRDIHPQYNKEKRRYEIVTSPAGRVEMLVLGFVYYYRHKIITNLRGASYEFRGDDIIRLKKWGLSGDEKHWATAVWVDEAGGGRFKIVAPWERIEFKFTHPPRRPACIRGVNIVVRGARDRSVRFSKVLLRKPQGGADV